jgi:pyruvate formate lyase activating enzyme
LDTVLEFTRLAYRMGVHVEITTLVVPDMNDSEEELDSCADFIAGLSASSRPSGSQEVPWHLSAYHPDYRWNAPATSPAFLLAKAERAKKKVRYVYTGNITSGINDTLCPHCGSVLVRRRGYQIDASGLAAFAGEPLSRCAKCGEKTMIVGAAI